MKLWYLVIAVFVAAIALSVWGYIQADKPIPGIESNTPTAPAKDQTKLPE